VKNITRLTTGQIAFRHNPCQIIDKMQSKYRSFCSPGRSNQLPAYSSRPVATEARGLGPRSMPSAVRGLCLNINKEEPWGLREGWLSFKDSLERRGAKEDSRS
jgi:hypothetical protein